MCSQSSKFTVIMGLAWPKLRIVSNTQNPTSVQLAKPKSK